MCVCRTAFDIIPYVLMAVYRLYDMVAVPPCLAATVTETEDGDTCNRGKNNGYHRACKVLPHIFQSILAFHFTILLSSLAHIVDVILPMCRIIHFLPLLAFLAVGDVTLMVALLSRRAIVVHACLPYAYHWDRTVPQTSPSCNSSRWSCLQADSAWSC